MPRRQKNLLTGKKMDRSRKRARRSDDDWVASSAVPAGHLHVHTELMLLVQQKENATRVSRDMYPPKPSEIAAQAQSLFANKSAALVQMSLS